MRPLRSITSITDTERSGEDPVHARVRRQDRSAGLESLTELRLEVTGDRDHDGRGVATPEVIDQLELLFWPQRGLQDDDVVSAPGALARLHGVDRLERDA